MAKSKLDNSRVCGDCVHCTPYLAQHTISITGKPTMGTCPYWKKSKCVLLSQPACENYVKRILTGSDGVLGGEMIKYTQNKRNGVRIEI